MYRVAVIEISTTSPVSRFVRGRTKKKVVLVESSVKAIYEI